VRAADVSTASTPGVTLLLDEDRLWALREEWSALFARAPGAHFSQSFAWASNAWKYVARPRGRQLVCIVLRENDRLVGLWPLVVYTDRGARVLRPLGYEGSEYSLPLVEGADEAAATRLETVWAAARKTADLAFLPQLKTGSAFADAVRRASMPIASWWPAPAPFVSRAAYADWPQYQAALSSSLRREIGRARRRLAEHGSVTIERESADRCSEVIDWMIGHKSRWLSTTGRVNDWIDNPQYRDFLVALARTRDGDDGGIAVFALRVEGRPVAGYVLSFDRTRAEGLLVTHDPAWRAGSPGSVLAEHVIRWAFERGLDFDFRPGDEAYKDRWGTASIATSTWLVACTWRGVPRVAWLRLKLAAGAARMRAVQRLPDGLRRRLRAVARTLGI
jgi:CelD/BcsL family acetyltransferase involved in cellulose biosynthesis